MSSITATPNSETYSQLSFEMGVTRKRSLRPDKNGRYRPQIGFVLFETLDVSGHQEGKAVYADL